MKQQINLLQEVLFEKKPPLNCNYMLTIFIGCGLLIFIASGVLSWQQRGLDQQLNRVRLEQEGLRVNLKLLKEKNPPRKKNPELNLEMKKKKAALARRKPLLVYLDLFTPGMTQGFSAVLEGLARHPLEGVWLTDVRLNRVEKQVLLAGSAVRADLVPAYLQQLSKRKILNQQTFASLKLTSIENGKQRVDFRLKSEFGVVDE